MEKWSCSPASPANLAPSRSPKKICLLLREPPISADLRAAVRAGHATPEQKIDIVSGSLALPPADFAEMLAILSMDDSPSIAEAAHDCISTQPLASFIAALARTDADPRTYSYCAEYLCEQPGVADALAKNIACPPAVVTRVSACLSSEGIQALLDNLDRLSSDPELGTKLAASTAATPEQQDLLGEIPTNVPLKTQEIEDTAAEAVPDVQKRKTLLQRLGSMNVVQRIQLAVKGGREERGLLIRDPNKIVQRAVLQSPRLTDLEVENFASMANVSQEVLRNIAKNRAFMKSYIVLKNLAKNPKSPIDITLHLLPRLIPADLKQLAGNKNVPETLRSSAQKLQRQRNMARPPE